MIRKIDHAISALAGVIMVIFFTLFTVVTMLILDFAIEIAIVSALVYAVITIFKL